jgi:hypothetical protein
MGLPVKPKKFNILILKIIDILFSHQKVIFIKFFQKHY